MDLTTLAAVQTEANGDLVVAELELPDPAPDQVRVRMLSSGVCHSSAGMSRVRPVALGAATTILGVAPLIQDAFWVSMALVIMFGGNDAQGITTPNGVAQPFSDAWIAEYSARVGAVMDQVTQGSDRQVLWVGQPIMRSGDFDAKMQQLNSIYEAEARSRPTVTFVSTRALFQNPAGQYDRYLPGSDGDLVDVRLSDGVHLSTAGGRWLSELLLDELATLYDLESGRLTP